MIKKINLLCIALVMLVMGARADEGMWLPYSINGQNLADMALAWILKDDSITSVIIGASKPIQILENVKAIKNSSFTAEELRQIDRISGR